MADTQHDMPPVPASLGDLVAALCAELGEDGLTDLDDRRLARVKFLMDSYKSKEDDWKKYAVFDPYKYTRNLVDDGNGKFNLMVIAWGEGHATQIHDHAGSHCLMKMLDGTITELLYETPSSAEEGGPLQLRKESQYHRDQCAYINDTIGLHRIENRSHTHRALSLHLYTPPYSECKMFNEGSGQARTSGRLTFHTVKGERVTYPNLSA